MLQQFKKPDLDCKLGVKPQFSLHRNQDMLLLTGIEIA